MMNLECLCYIICNHQSFLPLYMRTYKSIVSICFHDFPPSRHMDPTHIRTWPNSGATLIQSCGDRMMMMMMMMFLQPSSSVPAHEYTMRDAIEFLTDGHPDAMR